MNMRAKVNIERAARLWNDGATASELGELFQVTRNSICSLASSNRHLFREKRLPSIEKLKEMLETTSISKLARQLDFSPNTISRKLKAAARQEVSTRIEVNVRTLAYNRVVRTTFTGAKVTMPRVVFIDGEA